MSYAKMKAIIVSNPTLKSVLESDERKAYFNKLKGTKKPKKARQEKLENGVHLFNKRLVEKSCEDLARSVLESGIREKDRYFFESGFFEFYQTILKVSLTKDDYIKFIDAYVVR